MASHFAFQQLCCSSWVTYFCIVFLGPNTLAMSCWCLPLDLAFVLSAVPFSHYHLLFSSLKQCMAYLLGIHLTMDLKNISLLWEQLWSVLSQSHPSCSSLSSSSLLSTDSSEMEQTGTPPLTTSETLQLQTPWCRAAEFSETALSYSFQLKLFLFVWTKCSMAMNEWMFILNRMREKASWAWLQQLQDSTGIKGSCFKSDHDENILNMDKRSFWWRIYIRWVLHADSGMLLMHLQHFFNVNFMYVTLW